MFIGAFLFLVIFLLRVYQSLRKKIPRRFLLYSGFVTDVVILRLLQWHFEWPSFLYHSALFEPGLFYSSPFLPSLGDLLINSVLLLVVSYAFYLEWPSFDPKQNRGASAKTAAIAVLTGVVALLFAAAGALISEMVTDSSIPLNLRNISSLDVNSLFAFSALALVFLSIFLVISRLFGFTMIRFGGIKGNPGSARLGEILVFIVLAAMFSTLVLNRENNRMERERRKIIAMKLAARRNPVTEVLLGQISQQIRTDSMATAGAAGSPDSNSMNDAALSDHIIKSYFNDSWNNYTVQITVCRPGKMLSIQPQGYIEDCNSYFEKIIGDFGQQTSSPLLYYLDYGYGNENYLIIVPFGRGTYKFYIEISSKLAFKDLGYPELLVDKKLFDLPDISEYSYGIYQKDQLVQRVGKYAYSFGLDSYERRAGESLFFKSDGMDHYLYHINRDNTLLDQQTLKFTVFRYFALFIPGDLFLSHCFAFLTS